MNMPNNSGDPSISPKKVIRYCGVMPGMHVADIGTGAHGFFAIPMAQMVGNGGRVYAIDILKSALEATKRKASLYGIKNIDYIWSDVERVGATNVPRGTIDFCFIINTLFQAKSIREVLLEAAELTKNRGKIVVIDWDPGVNTPFPPKNQRVSKDEIKKIAKEIGLHTSNEFMASKNNFGLILDKIIT